ncbi:MULTISPECIES: hypothetical protein [Pseudonocardia]|uniref:hypothetical protein n=1 Tax=Pseudonocardia TaxID=1847 RepID=UPI001AD67205|nr:MULTISPECIES: hypothetical protein [Pseudonocardia]
MVDPVHPADRELLADRAPSGTDGVRRLVRALVILTYVLVAVAAALLCAGVDRIGRLTGARESGQRGRRT